MTSSSVVEKLAVTRAPSRPRRRGGLPQVGRPGIGWAMPAFLFFGLFALVPLAFGVYLSFTSYEGIRLVPPTWIGLDNWVRLFKDPQVLQSLTVTLILVLLAVVTQTPLSILIGVWAAGNQRGRAIVVAIYFVPLLMSTAAVTVLWASMLDPNFGIPAALPWLFGDGNLLGNQWSALGVIAFIYLWGATPLHTLIYQGAARSIPRTIYQAAEIDGAGTVRQFFSITLPQLRATIVTDVILIVVGTFTTFDLIFILTGGGPNQKTAILPFFMYEQGFQAFDIGYGSAVAIVLVVICGVVSIAMVRLTGFEKMESSQEGV
ncbi:carbohydrate ABC transporter permease [Subtercola frigoramans]|uniref:Xylobiose transport system permease protein n=1 Tax=Subtercola frigoramans TaxID=120298 RepID=A0ABS2L0S9_9MICO|nr:sugar ABC transporter permease [Subtercola frigoramans]MBM7470673.1 xylobiose transport system permease protein [Subtercola frigoramans]